MSKPLVGVIGSGSLVNGRYAAQLVGEKNLRAVAQVADALPLMFGSASDLTDIGPLLDTVGEPADGYACNTRRAGRRHDARQEPEANFKSVQLA